MEITRFNVQGILGLSNLCSVDRRHTVLVEIHVSV